jgi:hypothetical protein
VGNGVLRALPRRRPATQNPITPVIPSGKTPEKGKKKMPFFNSTKILSSSILDSCQRKKGR